MTRPPVSDTFHWTEAPWGAALRCRPLSAVAPHLFSTRQLRLSNAGDTPTGSPESGWRTLARAMDVEDSNLRRVTQVHGHAVVLARSDGSPDDRPEADALISDDPSLALAVLAADCAPLLMADARTGAVAAVHAGWRGTAASVAVAAVEALRDCFGTRPGDLIVAIGPSIGPCCYEVGTELVDAFAAAGHERSLIDRWFLAPPPRRGESHATRPTLRLDVPGANRDQLILAGVAEERIHLSGVCTAMHLDLLTSFRAERERAERLVGAIRAPRRA